MPTVPAYDTPNTHATAGPEQRVDASVANPDAAVTASRQQQQFGQHLQQAGANLGQIAVEMAQQRVTLNVQEKARKTYADSDGLDMAYRQTAGNAAVNGFGEHIKALEKLTEEALASVESPLEKQLLGAALQNSMRLKMNTAATHAAQEGKRVAADNNIALHDNEVQNAIRAGTTPGLDGEREYLSAKTNVGHYADDDAREIKGLSPKIKDKNDVEIDNPAYKQHVAARVSNLAERTVAALINTDPAKAKTFLQAHGEDLLPSVRAAYTERADQMNRHQQVIGSISPYVETALKEAVDAQGRLLIDPDVLRKRQAAQEAAIVKDFPDPTKQNEALQTFRSVFQARVSTPLQNNTVNYQEALDIAVANRYPSVEVALQNKEFRARYAMMPQSQKNSLSRGFSVIAGENDQKAAATVNGWRVSDDPQDRQRLMDVTPQFLRDAFNTSLVGAQKIYNDVQKVKNTEYTSPLKPQETAALKEFATRAGVTDKKQMQAFLGAVLEQVQSTRVTKGVGALDPKTLTDIASQHLAIAHTPGVIFGDHWKSDKWVFELTPEEEANATIDIDPTLSSRIRDDLAKRYPNAAITDKDVLSVYLSTTKHAKDGAYAATIHGGLRARNNAIDSQIPK